MEHMVYTAATFGQIEESTYDSAFLRIVTRYMGSGIKGQKWGVMGMRDHRPGPVSGITSCGIGMKIVLQGDQRSSIPTEKQISQIAKMCFNWKELPPLKFSGNYLFRY